MDRQSDETKIVEPGGLYVVATPIGHLEDVSLRAIAVLGAVDVVLAEDTRHSKKLLVHHGIQAKRLKAFHEHNESQSASVWGERLAAGYSIALISDAGTPLVSDPGFALLSYCRAHGLAVYAVPGPCAFVAALSVAGLPSYDVRFMGFLPAKSGPRCAELKRVQGEESTLIFYEAPHRLIETLTDMTAIFGAERSATLAHDLTKFHESVIRADLQSCLAQLQREPPRGEWVIVVEGQSRRSERQWPEGVEALLRSLQAHLPTKTAATIVAGHYGVNKKACYQWLLQQKRED